MVHVYLRGTFCIVLVFSTALVLLEGHFERERRESEGEREKREKRVRERKREK